MPSEPGPRIPYVRELTPELRELFGRTLTAPGGEPLHIFATLGHHPKLLKRFNLLGGLLLGEGLLPAREREIVILRVGWRSGSVYEFGQHTIIGRSAGLSDDEIRALATPDAAGTWSDDDRLLVALADELCGTDDVSEETWAGLQRRWGHAELVELLVLAGFYRLVSGYLRAARVELDPGVPGWPEGTTPPV